MISIDCSHPDIEEFINVKKDLSKVTKANISVKVNEEFMDKVLGIDKNPMMDLQFYAPETNDYICKKINAKKLFRKLCENNWDYAEPGILFWDRIKRYNLLEFDEDFEYAGVNPCAEEPLPAGGSCLLGSFNLSAYVKDKRFDFNEFKKDIPIVVKAMNDVLDEGLELHPLDIQKQTVHDYRQIGIGVMGIADMLIKMEMKYGDIDSIELCNTIGYTLANHSLRASSLLAKEYGTYPKYKKEILNSEFIYKNTSGKTRELIEKYGLRNSQLLTIAPTGTISTMWGISGGIEPIFNFSYIRKTESLHGHDKYYTVYTPIVEEYMKKNDIKDEKELPSYFITTEQISPKNRIDMQSVWQRHIDASISSTINLPNKTTVEEVEEIYKCAYKKGLKGLTIYRDGCARSGILLNESSEEKGNEGNWLPIPEDTIYIRKKIHTGCGKLVLFVGYSPLKKRLTDFYVKRSAEGGCVHNIDATVISMSGMLRLGGNLYNIEKAFEGCGACNSFVKAKTNGKKLSKGKSCPTAILNAIKEVEHSMKNIKLETETENKNEICPECGEKINFSGGCIICPSCGFSKCE